MKGSKGGAEAGRGREDLSITSDVAIFSMERPRAKEKERRRERENGGNRVVSKGTKRDETL